MSMQFKIDVQDNGALLQLERYPGVQKTVVSRALNRTADWSRTRTLDAITGNLDVKKSDLDGRHRFGGVTVAHATPDRLLATVNITGDRIPLFRFKGKPSKLPVGMQKGISYQIDAGGGKKRLTVNAFLSIMGSSHEGFFKRVSGATKHVKTLIKHGKRAGKYTWSEHPVVELYGPSIPHVAEQQPAFKKLLEVDAGERLALQIQRETNFALTGSSKGVEGLTGA